MSDSEDEYEFRKWQEQTKERHLKTIIEYSPYQSKKDDAEEELRNIRVKRGRNE